jgi:hypothetical protein
MAGFGTGNVNPSGAVRTDKLADLFQESAFS